MPRSSPPSRLLGSDCVVSGHVDATARRASVPGRRLAPAEFFRITSQDVLQYVFSHGLDHWMLWAFLFFALNYITYIGSAAACVPPLVMAHLDPTLLFLWLSYWGWAWGILEKWKELRPRFQTRTTLPDP